MRVEDVYVHTSVPPAASEVYMSFVVSTRVRFSFLFDRLRKAIKREDPETPLLLRHARTHILKDFRALTGPGIRLDGAIGSSGAVITSFYDSLLVKLIAKGHDFHEAIARACRALRETKIHGVATNIPFILNVLQHPKFLAGTATTRFIDQHSELLFYDPLDMSSQNICKLSRKDEGRREQEREGRGLNSLVPRSLSLVYSACSCTRVHSRMLSACTRS